MFKNGFTFKVKKNGIIGVIDGVTTTGIYSVAFYENGSFYYRADVYEGTIRDNLEHGYYEEMVTDCGGIAPDTVCGGMELVGA